MFIKQQTFEKMLKIAYKGTGFSIAKLKRADKNGEVREKYIIQTGYWRLETDAEYFPKEAKASIVKMIGELPALGECYRVDDIMIQNEMPETVSIEYPDGKDIEINKTSIYLRCGNIGLCRIYQAADNEIYIINTLYDEAVRISAIDEEYESVPQGPYVNTKAKHIIFWINETTLFQVGKIYIDEEGKNNEIVKQLEQIALTED